MWLRIFCCSSEVSDEFPVANVLCSFFILSPPTHSLFSLLCFCFVSATAVFLIHGKCSRPVIQTSQPWVYRNGKVHDFVPQYYGSWPSFTCSTVKLPIFSIAQVLKWLKSPNLRAVGLWFHRIVTLSSIQTLQTFLMHAIKVSDENLRAMHLFWEKKVCSYWWELSAWWDLAMPWWDLEISSEKVDGLSSKVWL